MIERKLYLLLFIGTGLFVLFGFTNCGGVKFETSVLNSSLGTLGEDLLITNTDQLTITGKCDTRSKTVSISGPENKSAICQAKSTLDLEGQFSFETNEYKTDGARTFTFTQNISDQTISNQITWYRDTEPPLVNNTVVNGGQNETGRPVVQVNALFTDNMDFLKTSTHIQVKEADLISGSCISKYDEQSWGQYGGADQAYASLLSFFTGNKKVCVWAKDYAGNISIMPSPGQDAPATDSIFLNIGNIPTFTHVSVENTRTAPGVYRALTGDEIEINYEVTDQEGLAAKPINIYITTDGKTWKPLIKNYGSSPEGIKSLKGSYKFLAPSNDFFRVMLVAKDKASNTSYETLSQAYNSGDWSVYAGNSHRGLGQSALSVSLSRSGMASNAFAVDPQSLDVFALDEKSGLIQIDAYTGLSKVLIQQGSTFLPDRGRLTEEHRISANYTSIKFNNTTQELVFSVVGRTLGTPFQSQIIYIYNTKTNLIRKVAGGGLENDLGADPFDLFLMAGNFALDESDNIYIHTTCTPGYWDKNNIPEYRLLKIINSEGSYKKVERIAGGCSADNNGKIEFGQPAFDNHYNVYQYAKTLTDVAAWDNGKNIYISSHGGAKSFKILNGIIHEVEDKNKTGGLFYSFSNKKLYMANNTLTEITPNLEGSKGETYQTIIAQKEGPGCTQDGKIALEACAITSMLTGITQTPHGYLFFADGINVNRPGYYRVRVLSPQQKIYSMAGHLPFYGNNEDKSVIRSNFAGIHYKTKSEANQGAFPEGLYFVDKDAAVFGYINPTTNNAKVLAGNQSRITGVATHTKGKAMSNLNTLGNTYRGGSMFPLAFDSDGLPWMRSENYMTHINKDKIVQAYGNRNNPWQFARPGDDVFTISLWPHGGRSNFSMKDKGVFLFGSYENGILGQYYKPNTRITYFDYAKNEVLHVMGGTGRIISADSSQAGDVASKSLNSACNNGRCSTYYDKENDILYFSELRNIRKIKNPTQPSQALLTTLDLPTLTEDAHNSYQSFTLSKDKKRIFVVVNGHLKCYDLVGSSNLCDGSRLGPSQGLGSISQMTNQLTWKSEKELLISTAQGTILLYKLPD